MNIDKPSSNFIQLPFMKRKETAGNSGNDNADKKQHKLPFIGFLPNRLRNHFIAMVGEFVGTFLFLFFAFAATQVANSAAAAVTDSNADSDGATSLAQVPNAPVLLYIALAFGFSLAVNAWVFFRISGGLFNPAVTLGLAMIGGITWVRAGLVFIAEMLAGMCAAGVVAALFPGPMAVSTELSSDTSIARGLFIEMFLTAELVFTIFMLAAEKHKGTFLAPVGIGLSLFVAELAGVFFTGGSLNPARSFGPCVALASFPGYHWIYWLGPCLGTFLAVGLYRFVKILEYETANPGQDFNEKEAEVFAFDEDNAATGADVARPNVATKPDYIADREGLSPAASRLNSAGTEMRGSNVGAGREGSGPFGGAGEREREREVAGMHPGYGSGDAAYARGPDAETGAMGGSYRPSTSTSAGGRAQGGPAPQLSGPVH
ncbi:Aquaporin-1 [Saxophila tyrrhenica]|uniref:Aquaporin-1 n=1 Tax=Saxophila tyrrhenica TaxID=1690608 RepID=A0AAV9NUG3_9PEZI|nr:Aquaporin-1 [Saxophila tyrrhenica]